MSLKHHRSSLIGVSLLSFVLAGVGLMFTLLNGLLMTHLSFVTGAAYFPALFGFISLTIATTVLTYYHERWLSAFTAKWVTQQLARACDHVLQLPSASLVAYPAGVLAKYFSHYEFGLQQALQSVSAVCFAGIGVLGLFIYIALQLPSLLLPILLLMMLSLTYKALMFAWQFRVTRDQLTTQTAFSSWLSDAMFNVAKLRQAYALPYMIKQGVLYLTELKSHTTQFTFIQLALASWDGLFLLALTLLIQYQLNVALLPLLLMLTQLTSLLDRLSAGCLQSLQARESMKPLMPILNTPLASSSGKIKVIPSVLSIAFEEVSYQAPNQIKPMLNQLSFHVNQGDFLALIGPSGVGKSTVLRLILGLISPCAGRILINGIDLHHYDLSAWRLTLGVVLQNSQLLNATIYANIAGASRATLDDAWALAEVVGLADDIRRMPMGMFTRVSDQAGESLSGGQRQKVLLARALAKKPKILILDEASSALDNISQAKIQAHLASLGVMRLVVAHRLSSIAEADVVYQLKQDSGLHVIRDSRALSSCSTPPAQSVLN